MTDSNNAHVLFNSVLLMKILAAGGESFIEKIVQSNTLDVINKLMERSLDEGQERIHFEAARLLVIIANSSGNYFILFYCLLLRNSFLLLANRREL